MPNKEQFDNIEIDAEDGYLQRIGLKKVQFNDPFSDGASGWFDDGANFRITVVNGLITAIEDSTAGGHS